MAPCLVVIAWMMSHMGGAAAHISYRGTEDGFWRHRSVVVGKVVHVDDLDRARGCEMTLEVMATLTGPYDAAAEPCIETTFSYDLFMLRAGRIKPESMVLVILSRRYDGTYAVPEGSFRFMATGRRIVLLQSLRDPALQTTIARLREIRGPKAKSEATKPAAPNAEAAKR